MAKTTPGIDVRHARTCPAGRDPVGRCRCSPAYQAHVWSAREQKRIRKTFPTLAEAKAWRTEALVALRRGTMRARTAATLRQAWEAWLAGAREGSVRNRSGDVYKPSALRGYEASMRLRVLPELGGARLSDITRVSVQDLADRMLADGLDASTIRNTLIPLRAIFRRALARGEVALNPVAGVELPSVRGRRDRIASPAEAAALVAALPEDIVLSGRPRSTRACASASCGLSATKTSTWRRASFASSARGTHARASSSRRAAPVAGPSPSSPRSDRIWRRGS